MTLVKRLALLGTGLIGGSLALDWLRNGAVEKVVGWDAAPSALEEARERGIIQAAATSPEEAASSADLVLIATPVRAACELAGRLGPHLKCGQIVSDVASVKSPVVAAWDRACPPGVEFLGGHPLAGSEKNGPRAARSGIFRSAAYVLTPGRTAGPRSCELMAALVRAAGAEPLFLTAEHHDAVLAATSHLPHLSAVLLVGTAAELAADFPRYAAGGFADTTRVALSNPVMWRDICLSNREAILAALDCFSRRLAAIRDLVAEGKAAELEEIFAAAQFVRAQLGTPGEGARCVFSPPESRMARP